jgi:hypothetical protein
MTQEHKTRKEEMHKQDRQSTLNVTLLRFHASIVVVESNKYYTFWVCVCSLRYPACNAHARYFHLWPVWLQNIFLHRLIKGTIFEKNLLIIKCGFWFSIQSFSEVFLILRTIERVMINNVDFPTCKATAIHVSLNDTLIFSAVKKKKYPDTKFHENPSYGSRVVRCGLTDWRS